VVVKGQVRFLLTLKTKVIKAASGVPYQSRPALKLSRGSIKGLVVLDGLLHARQPA